MAPRSTEDLDVHVLPVLNALLRHVKLIVLAAVLAGAAGSGFALVRGRSYTANSSFMPQATNADPSRLSGLAAQFGISIGAPAGGASPDFYVSLISSRAILAKVATARYTMVRNGRAQSGTAVDLLDVSGRDSVDRLEKTIELLQKRTVASADMRSGLVSLSVTAPSRDFAIQLNRNILTDLAEFNLHTRQSQARSEREFVESRTSDARAELASAEDAMTSFLEANRAYRESPQLTLEYQRLQQRVELDQQLYSNLATNLERARIDEVRDTPVLTVVDGPEMGVVRSHGPLFFAVVGLVFGAILGCAIAFLLEFLAYQRNQYPVQFGELTSHLPPAYRARLERRRVEVVERATAPTSYRPG